jgi:WD40 repeat protein
LWKFESRRCICATRVINTYNLHALDFGIENSSSSLLIVGYDEQSRTVVCIYNALNAYKGSIELISRATTDASITHIRFVPYDITKFLSIGLDNILFWRIKNEKDLQSINISINDLDHLEYTNLQFEYLSKNKLNELIVYITTKTGHILELLYDERRIIKIYYLSDKITINKESSFNISTLTCTNHFFITGSNDGYIRVWSKDFSQVYIEAKYDQSISGLISSYDQTQILISTISGSLNILNLVTKVHLNLMRTHTKLINDIDYDDIRKQMISVGDDGTIRIWCFRTGKQLSEFISEKEIPLIVTYTPNRQLFACGFNNGTIKIFDLNISSILNELK